MFKRSRSTSRVQREISVSVATNGPFWQIDFYLFCLNGKMILPRLKSSILAGFCKLNRCWSVSIIFHMQTRCKLYDKYNGRFCTCTNRYQASPWGGRGGEARFFLAKIFFSNLVILIHMKPIVHYEVGSQSATA